MTGGLRKRARCYLNVPSTTVSDGRLSFKARGILAYLLDKPAGWDVRSVAIAADSPDGKAAVQAGLRELARAGYYRIERRRLLDGRLVTGTAVSEEPVASWASEYAEYQCPVPVVQQPDGSFKVQHKDGSLAGDGFADSPGPEPPAPEPAGDGDGGVSAGRTGIRFSGAGSAGAGQTGAGSAGAGKPGAFINTEEPLQRTSSPLSPRPRRPAAAAGAQKGEDEDRGFAPRLDALVAEIRLIRPEWSSRSILRALAHPDVTERGWDRARRAMLAVATDPDSGQPGRLAHDGPWWSQPNAAGPGHSRPPWCGQGECDEHTRLVHYVDGAGRPGRCPRCHPLAAGSTRQTHRAPEARSGDRLPQTAVSGSPASVRAAQEGREPGAQLPSLSLSPPDAAFMPLARAAGAGAA